MTQDLKCEVLPAGDKVNPHTTNEINTIASFLNLQSSFNRKEWMNQINPFPRGKLNKLAYIRYKCFYIYTRQLYDK